MLIQRAFSNLSAGTKYVFKIRSYSPLGVPSNWSESITYTTPIGAAPEAPTNLITDFSSPDLIIHWSPPSLNIDGTPSRDINYYIVRVSSTNISQVHTSQQPSFTYNFQQNALDFGTAQPQVDISVSAVDVAGNISSSISATAINAVPPMPSTPAISIRSNLIVISMTVPLEVKDFSHFILEESTDNTTWTVLNDYIVGTTYTDQVTIGSTRYYRYSVVDVFRQIGSPSLSATAAILGGSFEILAPNGHPALILGYQPDGSIGLAIYDPITDTKVMQAGQVTAGDSYGLAVLNRATNVFQLVSGTSYSIAAAAQSTSSTSTVTFGDDPSVTAVVGISGQAEVQFGMTIGTGGDGDQGISTLTIDGTGSVPDRVSVSCSGAGIGVQSTVSRTTIISGLTAGIHTFSLNYSCATGVHGVTFTNRFISVSPF